MAVHALIRMQSDYATVQPAAVGVIAGVPSAVVTTGQEPASYPTARSEVGATGSPSSTGAITVNPGQNAGTYDNYIINGSVIVWASGTISLQNCTINGAIIIYAKTGYTTPNLTMNNCLITAGIVINSVDATDNLYWAGPQPAHGVSFTDCYVWHYSDDGATGNHVECMTGFGYPEGVRFTRVSFALEGIFGQGNTAAINYYGKDTIWDTCFFGWEKTDGSQSIGGSAATYYAVYIRPWQTAAAPNGATIQNSAFQSGTADYVYPQTGETDGVYINCVDYPTGNPISLP